MIPMPASVRVWMAGHTDMRKGMQGLALLVQEGLGRDPHAGDVFVFRGRSGALIKALWHDGLGLSLYTKRLDQGRFVWPATVDGAVATYENIVPVTASEPRIHHSADFIPKKVESCRAKRGQRIFPQPVNALLQQQKAIRSISKPW